MYLVLATCTAMLLSAALATPLLAQQDRAADLRSRLEHEPNAVQRAKIMADLGDAEFQEIRGDIEKDNVREALALLKKYREEARTCARALEDRKIDAEKHPSGFKQLQISVQTSLRRIDALMPNLTSDDQVAFRETRNELDELNQRLIKELFPGRPSPGEAPKRPAK